MDRLLHHSGLLHHSLILVLSVSGHVLPHHRIIGVVDLRLTNGSHCHLWRWVLNFLFPEASKINDDGNDDTAAAASDRNTNN